MSLYESMMTMTVFSGLLKDPLVEAFVELLGASESRVPVFEVKKAYAKFTSLLYAGNETNWTDVLTDLVVSLPTCCMHYASKAHEIPRYMLDASMHELEMLSKAAALKPTDFFNDEAMAKWSAYEVDLQAVYLNRLLHISRYGYGIFAKYRSFRMAGNSQDYELVPVEHPDPVAFSDLFGYDRQHEAVLNNTKALLEGLPAGNVLLYGDAGTGKSATVKAVLNALAGQGLRLIEISKKQLRYLPRLLDDLSENPLKFILFIDDLSFQENDDDFSALKAVLEGSVSARSLNTVIYATSNRRHIVRETFSARQGDDIHRNDTMQETISLSERFSLKVLFEKPTLQEYEEIVKGLASLAGLEQEETRLISEAERFALAKSGRSPRAARQFVEKKYVQKEHEKNRPDLRVGLSDLQYEAADNFSAKEAGKEEE